MAKHDEAKTTLIIEDEAAIRKFASRVLEMEGYRVLQAENGEEGLRLVRESRISVVLLDLKLPGCDGWAVLEEMKGEPELAVIPVIVFTASAGTSARDRALGMGAADYLIKPLSAANLREAVAHIVGRKR